MSDPEKKICRYFNTLGGCWYGDSCKFLHIPNKKPPCKFYGSSTGCRYGESCHFSHDRAPFKSVENYTNPPVEVIKEVFKENVDPIELSGTNNNNMTQPMTTLLNTEQPEPMNDPTNPDLLSTDANQNMTGDFVHPTDDLLTKTGQSSVHEAYPTAAQETLTGTDGEVADTVNLASVNATQTNTMPAETSASNLCVNVSLPLISMQATSMDANYFAGSRGNQDMIYRDATGNNLAMTEDCQNYSVATLNGRTSGLTNEMEIFCGSCKRVLERRGNESYCTLLKDHYLECFLDKEGDHVKYVKTKAALEPGQMYWCKSCILIFEKPWSLFQHMADKAKGCKVQRWEKKIHLDWMDNVAGLMAGYDLGLFSPAKLRIDLRNLLADQHTMEEEMEVAAVTAAAMMQWLTPLSNPWRLQQREMMRKIEQLNRQMLRKANIGLNAVGAGYPMRAALTAAPVSASTSPSVNYMPATRNNTGSLPVTPAPQRYGETPFGEPGIDEVQSKMGTEPGARAIMQPSPSVEPTEGETKDDKISDPQDPALVGPLGDSNAVSADTESLTAVSENMGAAGDNVMLPNRSNTPTGSSDIQDPVKQNIEYIDTNNTNSAQSRLQNNITKNDETVRRTDSKRGYHSAPSYGYGGSKALHTNGIGPYNRGFNEAIKYQMHSRGSRTPGYGYPSGHFAANHHRMPLYRANRFPSGPNAPPTRGSNTFNPPSFHASMDFNCGFTDDEVEELLSQGINPWDSEASAALAVLRGEMDHLLD